jgi:hypothetical protein
MIDKTIQALIGDICLAVYNYERNELRTFSGRGVRPLFEAVSEDKDFFAGSCAADKTVGKAAALLFAHAGVKKFYGRVLSDGAKAVAEQYGIEYSFGKKVGHILNRDGISICPMEKLAKDFESPQDAFEGFSNFFKI